VEWVQPFFTKIGNSTPLRAKFFDEIMHLAKTPKQFLNAHYYKSGSGRIRGIFPTKKEWAVKYS